MLRYRLRLVLALLAGLVASGCGQERAAPSVPTQAVTRMELLAGQGISLAEFYSLTDIHAQVKDPNLGEWKNLLIAMGRQSEDPPHRRFSQAVWYYDAECIEGDGDYVAVLSRMGDLTGVAMPITSVRDRVDIEAGTAEMWFDAGGRQHHLTVEQKDDWLSPKVIDYLVELLAEVAPALIYVSVDLGGQDGVILCPTRPSFEVLKGMGIPLEPLR